jgi:hypothetical protein
MRNSYYGDNRDLVKWGAVAAHLAASPSVQRVVQVAFWRPSSERHLLSDGITSSIFAVPVLNHFRDIHHVKRLGTELGIAVDVFDREWTPARAAYFDALLAELKADARLSFVLLDPDIGLAPPSSCGLEHVAVSEVQRAWSAIGAGGALGVYQHARREGLRAWVNSTRSEYVAALGVSEDDVRTYECVELAANVVIHVASRSL